MAEEREQEVAWVDQKRRTPLTHCLQRRNRKKRIRRPRCVFAVVLALVILAPSAALAAQGITDLGQPTGDVSPAAYFPLDGFHRSGATLTASDRPELLLISAQNDSTSAVERWPVVKALSQFGTFSHVSRSVTIPMLLGSLDGTADPTFNLAHAAYRSRYVAFVHKDVLDLHDHPYQKLSPQEQALYARYARATKPWGSNDPDHFRATLANTNVPTSRRLPLVAIGGYVQTVSQFLTKAEFNDQTNNHQLSFSVVQTALQADQEPFDGSTAVLDVNAEANIITALICHADKSQPQRVCGRAVIKKLLKYVR